MATKVNMRYGNNIHVEVVVFRELEDGRLELVFGEPASDLPVMVIRARKPELRDASPPKADAA